MLKYFLIAFTIITNVSAQARIAPPQPDYSRYGSYSHQLNVYENTQRRLNELELEKYRRFREQVRRNTPPPVYTVKYRYSCCQRLRHSSI